MTALLAGFLIWASAAKPQAAQGLKPGNLVPNGGFEKGSKGVPASWQRPDGLTSFWVPAPKRKGRCLKIDTDVLKEQYRERQKELKKRPVPPPPEKKSTAGKKYSTVAAVEGVAFYSDWIPVKPGVAYELLVDVRTERGSKAPKVFVKGYVEDPRRPPGYRRRVAYKKYLTCKASPSWRTFSMTFHPTARTPRVKWIRVMLFAYWPPGVYYFDNVVVRPAVDVQEKGGESGKGEGGKKRSKKKPGPEKKAPESKGFREIGS